MSIFDRTYNKHRFIHGAHDEILKVSVKLQLREMDQSAELVIQALLEKNIPPRLMSMDPAAPLSLSSRTLGSSRLAHKSVSSLAMRGDLGVVEEEDGGAEEGSGSGGGGSAIGGGKRSASPRLLGFPEEGVQVL